MRRKYTGYPAFANFVASDADFFVLRRFDRLNARVLLSLQDDICHIEEQLDEIDRSCAAKNAGDINNGTVRYDEVEERRELIDQAGSKLKEYSQLPSTPESGCV